jgi:probable rRNA maturation factor
MNSISKNEISNLNLEYFNKNVATDVLSFPLLSGIDEINLLNQGYPENLGDMFFCRPILKRNASEYNKVLNEELQLVLIHGLLHLVGYSHKNEKELRKKENAILDKVWNGFITD